MKIEDLPTPALIVDGRRLESNLATMAKSLPGGRLRPHVKAHKTTSLAKRQRAHGHDLFCAATIREVEGMARAGLGEDLLLANEVLDASRLGAVARAGARVTVAVDSEETIEAARRGGVSEVLIDVNVGLARSWCIQLSCLVGVHSEICWLIHRAPPPPNLPPRSSANPCSG